MIFVAVGTQFPFDRLIRYVDEWAGEHQISAIAQIATGTYTPQYIQWERFMTTAIFNHHLQQADLIISHAGMGNIITALEYQKPIIVMNRQYELGEHRNNHQADGLEWMAALAGVYTATNETEIRRLLDRYPSLTAATTTPNTKRRTLTDFIDQAIQA